MKQSLLFQKSLSRLFSTRFQACHAIIAFFFLTLFSSGAFATTWFVKQGGTGSGTGWGDTSGNFQSIINAAASGDEVWVAAGTYQPVSGGSFSMKEGVKIYGGFAGNESSLAGRNLKNTSNKSTLHGNGAAVMHNFEKDGITRAALLDGFTITGGARGMINESASPSLVNLIITENTTSIDYSFPDVIGGGVLNVQSSPVFTNCIIRNNRAYYGGGMYNTDSSPILTNCIISNNIANVSNAMENVHSSPILTNCTIVIDPTFNYYINNSLGSFLKMRNCIISGLNRYIFDDVESTADIKYSLYPASLNPDDHNITGDVDPLFVDAANDNYQLQPCSPLINKGHKSFYSANSDPDLSAVTTDLAGNNRFDSAPDLGAYEVKSAVANVVFVKVGGTGPGTSWECPADLQSAINDGTTGTHIWVASGTYESADKGFSMKEGVKIYGGFAATEETLDQRNLASNVPKSVLMSSASWTVENIDNNLTHAAILDGFTIIGGFEGGIRNSGVSPKLVNLVITPNPHSSNSGSALSNSDGAPLFVNCLIANYSTINGIAVMVNVNASPVLLNCTISRNNQQTSNKNIISNTASSPTIRNSIIYGNSGGMQNDESSYPVVEYSLVQGLNSTDNHNIPGDIAPSFVNAASGDYRLLPCSPAINTGNNAYYMDSDVSQITTDLMGNSRFYKGANVDMGVYESQEDFLAPVPGVVFVKEGGNGSGTNWTCATGDLQAAVNAAASGQQVWVARGEYTRSDRKSFTMKDGVKIYGGFAGNEETLTQRDLTVTANKSTLVGNNGAVVDNKALSKTAVLDGFILKGASGSGIVNHESSPMLVNLIITYNGGQLAEGGGVHNISSSPTLINCAIDHNAGAMLNENKSSPVMINCTIVGNSTDYQDLGGIVNSDSSFPEFYNSIVYGNSGGIKDNDLSVSVVRYSVVQGLTDQNPDNHNFPGDTDPSFVDLAGGNFQLISCSPLVNTGSSASYTKDFSAIITDLAGNARIKNDNLIDLGAYEYQGLITMPVAGVLYVKAGSDGKGTKWQCAFGDLQTALNVATSGQQIWVAGGTYRPSGLPDYASSEDPRDYTFLLPNGVKLYGGFAGTETDINQRVRGNVSILSGGDINDTGGNAYHVVLSVGDNSNGVLDSFTISGGNADYDDAWSVGSVSVSRSDGGGMSVVGNAPAISRVVFDSNKARRGGGLSVESGTANISNSDFTNNFTYQVGGGIFLDAGSTSDLTNCIIDNNRTDGEGGGISGYGATLTLSNSIVRNNNAYKAGGMSFLLSTANVFSSNIISNRIDSEIGGVYALQTTFKTKNSIYWGNLQAQIVSEFDQGSGSEDVSYSLIAGGYYGEGNINADPGFINMAAAAGPDGIWRTADDGLQFNCDSPAANTGSGDSPALDILGMKRVDRIDLGAYEFAGMANELANDRDVATGSVSGDISLTVNGGACRAIAFVSPNGSSPVSGEITAKVWVEGTQPHNFVKRHYEITPATNASAATARITLYFTQQDFTDFNTQIPAPSLKLPEDPEDAANNKANLLIEKHGGTGDDDGTPASYPGTPFTFKPSDASGKVEWNAGSNRWEVSFEVTGFSGFFIRTKDSALPLSLISFSAHKSELSNLLKWSTASEVNTDNFEVQRSSDAKKFDKMAIVNAGGSGNHQYSYNDTVRHDGGVVYYRLKMNDLDGTFTFSKIISMTEEISGQAVVYPNPAGNTVYIQVGNTLLKSSANLYDITGRLIQRILITSSQQQINIKALTRGLYILKFADGTAERFVKE